MLKPNTQILGQENKPTKLEVVGYSLAHCITGILCQLDLGSD